MNDLSTLFGGLRLYFKMYVKKSVHPQQKLVGVSINLNFTYSTKKVKRSIKRLLNQEDFCKRFLVIIKIFQISENFI